MNCPACEHILTERNLTGLTIDYCSRCRGLWLDKGELSKIGRETGFQTIKLPRPLHRKAGTKKIKSRLCPVCPDIHLRTQTHEEIEVDLCPRCSGVWLDAGEIKLIFEKYEIEQVDGNGPTDHAGETIFDFLSRLRV